MTDWQKYAENYLDGDDGIYRNLNSEVDGTEPRMMEHLCIKDLTVQPGPVEECCINEWRDEGALP